MASNRIVHSIWGQQIQTQLLLGLPITLQPYTTLNEYHEVNVVKKLPVNAKPVAQYYCIGWGGHEQVAASDKPHIASIIQHDPLDAGLYNPMPFVLRRLNNDLTQVERDKYRLRKKVTVNGIEYIGYYLRKFDISTTTEIMLEKMNAGVLTTLPYTANEENLRPQKPHLSPRTAETTSDTKVKVHAPCDITFDENDCAELIEVAKILFGDPQYAVISEIGIVTGVDTNNYTSPIDRVRYTEIAGAVISAYISTFKSPYLNDDGFVERLSLGDKIPLLTTSPFVATVGGAPGSP